MHPEEILLLAADGRRQVVIVCDTNILVSAKNHLLMRLMDDWSHASEGEISLHVTALVPYIVLKVSVCTACAPPEAPCSC